MSAQPQIGVYGSDPSGRVSGVTFDEYVLTRGPALVRFARLLTGDEHRAEDLTQEVLAHAYVRWRRIASLDRPDVYLRRMLVNAHHSWWRRAANREVPVWAAHDGPAGGDTEGESVERDALWRLVRALPPKQRAVIVLRYYEDYDDATIAELMNCSEGTVRTHAKRALDRLQTRRTALETVRGDR
jgi:RNA polymerase sigma-70 factor (sigma-E family)